jgi:hypothetical protein
MKKNKRRLKRREREREKRLFVDVLRVLKQPRGLSAFGLLTSPSYFQAPASKRREEIKLVCASKREREREREREGEKQRAKAYSHCFAFVFVKAKSVEQSIEKGLEGNRRK